MFKLKEDSPIKMLRQFALHFNGDLNEDLGAAKFTLDNQNGKGTIKLFELFPGLTAWIYDIKLKKNFLFDVTFSDDKPYYFGYPLEGEQLQKFPDEDNYNAIKKGQNFIIVGEPNSISEFKIPSDKNFKCCYLIINPKNFEYSNSNKKALQINLSETLADIIGKKTYRYFGDIDLKTGLFAEIIIKNNRTDLVGRLLIEAAVLNMLASQIIAHDKDKKTESFQPDLSLEELSKLSNIGDYIKDNFGKRISIGEISGETGLSPKKLQAGFRFLYGYSVNQYISNVKLERAKELIYKTDKTISEICYEVGYSSRSYLSKIFFERYGVLPSEYKNSLLNNDFVYEVTYRSISNGELSQKEIEALLEKARVMNKEYDITGSLLYHKNVFFQMIEGSKDHILKLYDNIKNDDRHFDVKTLWQGVKKSRNFDKWNMAMLTDKNIIGIETQGNTKKLNIDHLMGDLKADSLISESLWRQVRTIINSENQ
ncbi:BLUF domain-containing protein [Psychroserpens sp. Hel_I_66]|uniref:BLUF domain-containing protein n=1 Tax=Psychroserpens sp. Hel_I_66 TaxID=1250004 RepID=UPI000689E0CA|nr:BLUF domain-containing protein [Psychroserpens sp. Hel_I_66]